MTTSDRADALRDLTSHLRHLVVSLKALKSRVTVEGQPDDGTVPLLYTLAKGPLRVGALAELCHLDLSTASRHASTLTQRGLVEKTPDESDRRAQVLGLTPAGRDLVAALRARQCEVLSPSLAGWDVEDLRAFDTHLTRFVNDVEHHFGSAAAGHDPQES